MLQLHLTVSEPSQEQEDKEESSSDPQEALATVCLLCVFVRSIPIPRGDDITKVLDVCASKGWEISAEERR
jgi:hypothetical protein